MNLSRRDVLKGLGSLLSLVVISRVKIEEDPYEWKWVDGVPEEEPSFWNAPDTGEPSSFFMPVGDIFTKEEEEYLDDMCIYPLDAYSVLKPGDVVRLP